MIIVSDIDGTLADISDRLARAGKQPSSWVRKFFSGRFQRWLDLLQDEKSLLADKPIPGMRDFLAQLSTRWEIIYLTGRSSEFRRATQQWLDMHDFPMGPLIMRPKDNFMSAVDFKTPHMRKIAAFDADVIVIDDDGDGTCEHMYRAHNYTHLKAMRNVK